MAEPFTDYLKDDEKRIPDSTPTEPMSMQIGMHVHLLRERLIADRKRIEELEGKLKDIEKNPLLRIDPDGSVHQIQCENCADQTVEIERLRGALEKIYDRAIGYDGFGYIVKIELRKIARQALDAGKE